MSSTLVKKSLDLFKDDLVDEDVKKKNKKKDPMKRISTKKEGVRKALQKLKKQDQIAKQLRIERKNIKSAVEDVQKKKAQDQTESNLDYILQFHQMSGKSVKGKMIVEDHYSKSQSRFKAPNEKEDKPQKEMKSILFSDREFDKEVDRDTFFDE